MNHTKNVDPLLPYEWPGSYYFGEEEIANVTAVLQARSPFRYYGHDLQHFTERLEEAYRRRLGRKHALAVGSGTAALSIAMGALGVGPGDEVLVPGYLWVSCLSAVVRSGAIPRLVEIDDTFGMDPEDAARRVTSRTKAMLIVHMSGGTGDLGALLTLADRHGIAVIEDVAQANGGSFRGRPLGSFGDVAIFSFQLNKNITAGEGGLVACDKDPLYRRAVALHDLGYPRNEAGRLVMNDPDVQMWGIGSRMSELTAAVLVAQEAKLDLIIADMRRAHAELRRGIEGIAGARTRRLVDADGDCGNFLLIVWPSGDVCAAMVERSRGNGVTTGPLGINNVAMTDWGLHLYFNNASLVHKRGTTAAGFPWSSPENAFAAEYDYGIGTLPTTDDLFERSSLLAVPPVLGPGACRTVVEAFERSAQDLEQKAPIAVS
jgi:dTDP-4-amino-4,6-dideoxygalactose transaminase